MSFFSEGIKRYEEKSRNQRTYPEELIDKKCGGCVRCKERDHKYNGVGPGGYHCQGMAYDIDISPDDKACVSWWDKEEYERVNRFNAEAEEKRREELWEIYAKKDPIKLPIINDGYGTIPMCPICGEMPYSTEQCHWCGQRFIQDEEVVKYSTPDVKHSDCFQCGGKGTLEYIVSKYNGHKHGYCTACGIKFME